jgi:hypothetical protein
MGVQVSKVRINQAAAGAAMTRQSRRQQAKTIHKPRNSQATQSGCMSTKRIFMGVRHIFPEPVFFATLFEVGCTRARA